MSPLLAKAARNGAPRQIDFLVAYILPEDAWYILPVGAIGPRTCVKLFTHHPETKSRYEQFREAWQLMSDPA